MTNFSTDHMNWPLKSVTPWVERFYDSIRIYRQHHMILSLEIQSFFWLCASCIKFVYNMLFLKPLKRGMIEHCMGNSEFLEILRGKKWWCYIGFSNSPRNKMAPFFTFKAFSMDACGSDWVWNCSAFAIRTPVVPQESNYGWKTM